MTPRASPLTAAEARNASLERSHAYRCGTWRRLMAKLACTDAEARLMLESVPADYLKRELLSYIRQITIETAEER